MFSALHYIWKNPRMLVMLGSFLGFQIFVSLLTFLFLLTARTLKRPEGAVMVLMYAAHMVFAVIR